MPVARAQITGTEPTTLFTVSGNVVGRVKRILITNTDTANHTVIISADGEDKLTIVAAIGFTVSISDRNTPRIAFTRELSVRLGEAATNPVIVVVEVSVE